MTSDSQKMKNNKCFDDKLTEEQLQNVANYFVTLPSEIAMSLWQVMGQAEQSTYNVSHLHSMTAKSGKKVQDFIVEILNAK